MEGGGEGNGMVLRGWNCWLIFDMRKQRTEKHASEAARAQRPLDEKVLQSIDTLVSREQVQPIQARFHVLLLRDRAEPLPMAAQLAERRALGAERSAVIE